MTDREKVIKGLEEVQHYIKVENLPAHTLKAKLVIDDAIALLKALDAFKSYFDCLYGHGLDVANYHLNGATEPFDSFYDSAMEEYEKAECK